MTVSENPLGKAANDNRTLMQQAEEIVREAEGREKESRGLLKRASSFLKRKK